MEAQENVAIDVSKQVINILRNEPFKNAVNMQTISSDHLNRLHPYFTLSEQLGKSLAQMTDGAVRDVTVGCAGDLAELDTSPLIPYVLKGILSHHLGAEHVNIVNATHLAKERDLNFVTQKSLLSQSSSNEIMIRMKTTKEEKSVRGSLLPELGERLVQIGPYPVDIPPSGQVLLISQMDRPGIIGRVGRVLGRSGINIVTMQVGRNKIGNSALMILKIDKKGTQKRD